MSFRDITPDERLEFNKVATHPLQSYEWGEFREKTGVKVIRRGRFDGDPSAGSGRGKLVEAFQVTIHTVPKTPFTIGYLPKGSMPTKAQLEELTLIGRQERCIFIQLEPNAVRNIYRNEKGHLSETPDVVNHFSIEDSQILNLIPSARPLFTKFTFVLDLTRSEDELLSNMHSKTRYNIKIARNKGVVVREEDAKEAFEEYLHLTEETTTRQRFYAHTLDYHSIQWKMLHEEAENREQGTEGDRLSSHLLLGKLDTEILVAWILFTFKDGLYYPYGASSSKHREVMASNLVMNEAILYGKNLGLKYFDMWGALGPQPTTSDSWYGFHRFKIGYGADLVEMIGSYDLVINPALYFGFKTMDRLRWMYLRLRK